MSLDSPSERILERVIDMVRDDPDLKGALIELLKAQAERERAKAAWYSKR